MFTLINEMLSAWAGVLIVFLAAILVTLSAIIWIVFFRKRARRRHRRRQHSDPQQPNPTLAQIGGLPPIRGKIESQPQTQTLTSRL